MQLRFAKFNSDWSLTSTIKMIWNNKRWNRTRRTFSLLYIKQGPQETHSHVTEGSIIDHQLTDTLKNSRNRGDINSFEPIARAYGSEKLK